MKKCRICDEEKSIDSFTFRKDSGKYRTECKPCMSARVATYLASKEGQEKARKYAEENRDEIKKRFKTYYNKNKEDFAARWADYYAEKKEDINAAKRERWAKNKDQAARVRSERRAEKGDEALQREREYRYRDIEKWREYSRHWQKNKRETDPKFRLHVRVSNAIAKSIKKGNKGGQSWTKLVGYSLDELVTHLKKTMPTGYTWDDYLSRKLHIDHIVPVSAHNFEEATDLDFKRAWALKNLQLLPAFDNMSKGAKLDTPFQPSLAIARG